MHKNTSENPRRDAADADADTMNELRPRVKAAEADAAEARNETASETRTPPAVCARESAIETEKENEKPIMPPNKTFVPIAEVSRVFGVSKRTIRRWVANGAPVLDLSVAASLRRTLRFSTEDLMLWIQTNHKTPKLPTSAKWSEACESTDK